jgi:class 3 adenylate cyclase
MQRRLAAIVHADLAGFTRMMEGAETRTFRHLKAAQIEVWRPAIQAGGGRMVGTAGDAMLAEFGSAVSAVNAAIEIQERMARFNEALDEAQRMLFRIGVHLGEVIVDQEDQNIFGDGVNLAARIQAIAEPGGIAVSRAVRDVTELRIDYAFVDGGEHQVKNVSRAVHVYHVHVVPDSGVKTTTRVLPQVTLRFEGADSAGQKFAFDLELHKLLVAPQGMVLGRASDQCELVLGHATVSRRHARLSLAGDALQVEDLGSTNGTAINGQAVRAGAPAKLQIGSKMKIGDVELQVRQLAKSEAKNEAKNEGR